MALLCRSYRHRRLISLPASLRLSRNTAAEARLRDASRAWLESQDSSRAEGIHASDLLNPLQAFWKYLEPAPYTDRQVPTFLIGKVLHSFVLGAMEGKVDLSKTDTGSTYSEDMGFWYSVDWDRDGEVAEFKSARFFKEPRTTDDLRAYISQLLLYMAAKNKTEAELWILLLNLRDTSGKTAPAFRAYRLRISEDDLVSLRAVVREHVQLLKNAIAARDPSTLPLCQEYICGYDNCPYWDKCKPAGRYGDPRWDRRVGPPGEKKSPSESDSP